MRIIVDAMGGDNAPRAIVEGAVLASREIPDNIVLVGNKEIIHDILAEIQTPEDEERNNVNVFPAYEEITNDDSPVKAIKRKPDSSIVVGLNIVNDGYGDVFISAGSTGALLVGGALLFGTIQGITRPAICTIYPVAGRQPSLLLDCGANAECKPKNLLEFAVMGSTYMEQVLQRENPTVGLVNIGTESKKGNTLTQKSYELLSESRLNFAGNLEAREIPLNPTDVIVTDGFTGNVILKLTEGMAALVAKMGIPAGKGLDYTQYGGAPLLGLKKPLVKMHGNSNANAVKNAIIKGKDFVETKVIDKIAEQIK